MTPRPSCDIYPDCIPDQCPSCKSMRMGRGESHEDPSVCFDCECSVPPCPECEAEWARAREARQRVRVAADPQVPVGEAWLVQEGAVVAKIKGLA